MNILFYSSYSFWDQEALTFKCDKNCILQSAIVHWYANIFDF